MLPSTSETLKQHILRAHVQARVWGIGQYRTTGGLSPLQNGFGKDANGDMVPRTTDDQPAPKAIIEMVNCQCKRSCSSQRFGCRSQNLACIEPCLYSSECQDEYDYSCYTLYNENTNYIMPYERHDLELLKNVYYVIQGHAELFAPPCATTTVIKIVIHYLIRAQLK